ncbi:hypothetical protein [Natronomonas amylolytica]|uniref:hypothetical protein n=1 Tax=Natronomonas amylolytica TaxID=3108498 RepID=UPI00300999A9
MSQGVAHFAVGATLTTLLVTFLVPNARYPRVWVLAGGAWAMLPDAAKLYSHPALVALHGSRWADVFWLHFTMDRLDSTDSALFGAVMLAALLGVTALAEYRGYRALSVLRESSGPGGAE